MTSSTPDPRGVLPWLLVRAGLGDFNRVSDEDVQRRLVLLAFASIFVSILEVVALIAIGPLIVLMAGGSLTDAGAAGARAQAWMGTDLDQQQQTLIMLGIVVGVLLLRAIAAATVRWWTISFINTGAARATTNLLAVYLRAPLAFHTARNTASLVRTAAGSLSVVFTSGLLGISTFVSEAIMIVVVGALLLIVSPLAAISAICYFAIVLYYFNRRVQRPTAGITRERDDIQAAWLMRLYETLGGLREIRLRHSER
jgi:ABC-type multidrug transport system fused ATPase/permease subunit